LENGFLFHLVTPVKEDELEEVAERTANRG
jgi:hypothetical protein